MHAKVKAPIVKRIARVGTGVPSSASLIQSEPLLMLCTKPVASTPLLISTAVNHIGYEVAHEAAKEITATTVAIAMSEKNRVMMCSFQVSDYS